MSGISHILGVGRGYGRVRSGVVVWGINDKSGGNIDLTNSLFTMIKASGTGWASARASLSRTSGKHYFEVKYTSFVSSFIAAGLTNVAPVGGQYPGQTTASIGMVSDGLFYHNAVSVASGLGALAANDIICFAVDVTNKLIWMRKNNGAWYGAPTVTGVAAIGDPELGTGGRPYPMAGAVAPIGGIQRITAPADTLTGYFAASKFNYSPPIGFLPWDTSINFSGPLPAAKLRVGFSSDLSLGAGSTTVLSFTSETIDSSWGFTPPNTNIVIPSGVTFAVCQILLSTASPSSAAATSTLQIKVNGTLKHSRRIDGQFYCPQSLRVVLPVIPGDIITYELFTDQAITLDSTRCFLSVMGY